LENSAELIASTFTEAMNGFGLLRKMDRAVKIFQQTKSPIANAKKKHESTVCSE
jgi:hypothetical protein